MAQLEKKRKIQIIRGANVVFDGFAYRRKFTRAEAVVEGEVQTISGARYTLRYKTKPADIIYDVWDAERFYIEGEPVQQDTREYEILCLRRA